MGTPLDALGVKLYAFPLTMVGIIFPFVVFLAVEAYWFWHNVSPGIVIVFCYIWVITLMAFLHGGLSDAGVLPLNINLPMDENYNALPLEYYNTIPTRPPEDHNQHLSGIKFCESCFIWRPIRATHCSRCGVCVALMDHHCPWLGNCVGQRNYWYFISFLVLLNITIVYLMVMEFYKIGRLGVHGSHWAIFLGVYTVLAFMYTFLLLTFHIYIGLLGITTREYLNMEMITGNPFKDVYEIPYYSPNPLGNLKKQWFRSRGWALWRAREIIPDPLADNRTTQIIVGGI
mgnify:CR=1 FL=1